MYVLLYTTVIPTQTILFNCIRFIGITKTRLYNVDSLKPHFYIVKLGFIGVYIIILISAQKCFDQKYEKYQIFYLNVFIFWW